MRTALPVLQGADDEWHTPACPRRDLAALFTLEIHGPGGSPRARAATVERAPGTSTGVSAQGNPGIREFDWGPFTATDDGEGVYRRRPAPTWRPN
jgi:hypothetical protein